MRRPSVGRSRPRPASDRCVPDAASARRRGFARAVMLGVMRRPAPLRRAAAAAAPPSAGKMQVTRRARARRRSRGRRGRRAARRRSARSRGRGRRRDGAVPAVWLSKRSKTRADDLGRDAAALVGDREDDARRRRARAATRIVWPGAREADRVREEVEQDLADALAVGRRSCRCRRARRSRGRARDSASRSSTPARGRLDRGADVDRARASARSTPASIEARSRMSLMMASSAAGRAHDVAGIFALALVERRRPSRRRAARRSR